MNVFILGGGSSKVSLRGGGVGQGFKQESIGTIEGGGGFLLGALRGEGGSEILFTPPSCIFLNGTALIIFFE